MNVANSSSSGNLLLFNCQLSELEAGQVVIPYRVQRSHAIYGNDRSIVGHFYVEICANYATGRTG